MKIGITIRSRRWTEGQRIIRDPERLNALPQRPEEGHVRECKGS